MSKFVKKHAKELKSILGDSQKRKEVDYVLSDTDESIRSPKAKFTNEDMMAMAECPEVVDNDAFFNKFWKERSSSLNEKLME